MSRLTKIGVVLVAFVTLTLWGHFHLRKSSLMYNFFFSPDDLYSRLAEASFDFSAKDSKAELRVATKYPGNHWLAILVEAPLDPPKLYESDFQLKIQIFGERGLLSESFVADSSHFFYGGSNYSGFTLQTYEVPDDLPLGEPFTIAVTVVEPDTEFESRYGKQRIIVSKFSDE